MHFGGDFGGVGGGIGLPCYNNTSHGMAIPFTSIENAFY